MPATVQPNAAHIWDEAEVWVIPRADVSGDDITSHLLDSVNQDPEEKGWEFVGLLDEEAGIPFNPELEITHYDGFGHPRYRSKAKKGALSTGFTALEDNDVTRKFILPGSADNKIGAPRGTYFWVLYIARDEDIAIDARVSTRPALFEVTNMSGFQSGQENAEIAVHHANDGNKDVFTRIGDTAAITDWLVTITGGPTGGTFTLTYRGKTTAPIAYNATAATVKAALVALDDGYDSSDFVVAGTAGGPYTVSTPSAGTLTASGAGLTGGTAPSVTVAPAA
ncbi:major tail protein [Gordonia phage RayTheFireFly]|nr:major tail protein [Gordonia phage RayTheFireFly]